MSFLEGQSLNTSAQQLYDSLLAYQFMPTKGKQWSHVALFKEYARRMAWWADALGVIDNWFLMNIAYVLELDENLNDLPLHKLDAHLQSQSLPSPMSDLLNATLMFAMVSEDEMIKQFQLQNPYDALVKLYMRGGYLRWNDRGFWEVSGAFGISGMERATYKVSTPFVSLNDEELNFIDKGDTYTPDIKM